jgi:predicted ATPase/DNA-binding SARP family transcriptional activator
VVEIRLLGGVEAVTAEGDVLDIGPARCRALLAALAIQPGTAVPVPRLVELVWGDDPPRTAAKTLQTYVGRLRRALGADRVVRVDAAYRLDVDPGAVDVVRFRRRLADGDVAGALVEWGGPPAAGLEADGLRPAFDGLTEQWLGAVEADLAARLEADPVAAVAPLTEACRANPYREGLIGLLMLALYRSGRQADALAVYGRARRRLVEELGIEPGPSLREIEARILAHDPGLTPGPSAAGPPAAERAPGPSPGPAVAADRRDGNLPAGEGSLVGRDRELDAVVEALTSGRLVTLVGPGGIGKTRLAVAAASRVLAQGSPEEGWYVALAAVADPAEVEREIAGTLGVPDEPGRPLARSLARALRGRRILVVLDNCEHVIEAAAAAARALVEAGDGVRVLATSREALGLGGERLLAVPPLAADGPAVELFDRRARAVDPGFDLAECRPAVVDICNRLDGLPLAIELAAARVRTLPPAQLVERLGDRLRLVAGGRRSDDDRHRTLRSTIRWSHDLLDEDERDLFRRLSVFAGPFDLAAAEAVAGPAPTGDRAAAEGVVAAGGVVAVDEVLDRLVGRSMVDVAPGPTGPRFRLLETIGQFGREELSASGAEEWVADRHTAWCLTEVERIGRELAGWDEPRAVARLAELWPDLRAAVNRVCDRGDHRLARALIDPVVAEVYVRNRSEIGLFAERLLEVTPAGDEDTRAFGVAWAARRYMRHQDRSGFERLVERFGEPDDPMIAYGRAFLEEDFEARVAVAPLAVDRLRAAGQGYKADLFAVAALAPSLLMVGRVADHDELMAGLIERFRRDGPPTCLSWALVLVGLSRRARREHAAAEEAFGAAAEVPIPPRTSTLTPSIEARALHERGQRRRAYVTLGGWLGELLEADDIYGAKLGLFDYLHLMLDAGRPVAAALAAGRLEEAGWLTAPAYRTGDLEALAEAREGDDAVALAWERGRSLGDRALLGEVVATLADLAAG